MVYKRDFYTLNLEKVLAVGGGIHPPPARSLRSLAQDLRQKGAPFEILSLRNSKCSGAPVCERVFSYFLDRQFPKHFTQSVHQIAQFQFRKGKNSFVWEGGHPLPDPPPLGRFAPSPRI